MLRRLATRSLAAAPAAALRRRGAATSSAAGAPGEASPRGDAGANGPFWELAKAMQPLLGIIAGAVVVGSFITAASTRSDVIAAELRKEMDGFSKQLEKQMEGVQGKLGEKMEGVEGKLAKQMEGVERTLDAKVAGVVATARAEAAAAAMTAVKDYGVSIAGGAASKT
jgi:hypothetical protein